MANLCTNRFYIYGNKKDISSMANKITNKDKKLLEICPHLELTNLDYGLYEDTFTPEEKSIFFIIGSKWSFPFQDLNNLINIYPDISFEITVAEPGMEIFQKIIGTEGHYEVSDISPIDYFAEVNEDFADEYNRIQDTPYDEFLKEYINISYYNEPLEFEQYLLPLIIKRIKNKDLPLFFINKEISEKMEYIERLKK